MSNASTFSILPPANFAAARCLPGSSVFRPLTNLNIDHGHPNWLSCNVCNTLVINQGSRIRGRSVHCVGLGTAESAEKSVRSVRHCLAVGWGIQTRFDIFGATKEFEMVQQSRLDIGRCLWPHTSRFHPEAKFVIIFRNDIPHVREAYRLLNLAMRESEC